MANWNLPTITSLYTDFVTEINTKFTDAAQMFSGAATNIPVGTLRFNRTLNLFDEWNGTIFVAKPLALAGGGTGSNTAAGARTNLGIGSMGTQNSDAVNITGGSIIGVSYSANDINTGILALARGGTGASLSLGAAGFVLLSDGSGTVYASGANISALNASALTVGTVPAARLTGVAILALPNTFTAGNLFNGPMGANGPVVVSGPYAQYLLYNAGNAVDAKNIRTLNLGGVYYIQRINDAYDTGFTLFSVDSSGVVNCNGLGITNLNGNNITSGIVNPARLGTGTPSASNFLRGDGSWQVASGSGGSIPSGLIAMFSTNCPAGWTRVVALDSKFPLGHPVFGLTGGAATHNHNIGINTSPAGAHSHPYGGSVSVSGDTGNAANNAFPTTEHDGTGSAMEHIDTRHTHHFNASGNYSGNTDGVADHSHQVNATTTDSSSYPPYFSVVYCQKD